MRKITALVLPGLAALFPAWGQDTLRVVDIEQVSVTERRILQDIGAQKTVLDTVSLRDNVTNSMADVLSLSPSVFIKSYGRATLATASFRGTAPSHTQVTWNDIKINSPMLGMVDFSTIPSYFIDDASLYHGASAVGVTGGGLGGAVALSTKPAREEGINMRFIQGVGSYNTWDEYLRVGYGGKRFRSSTRVSFAKSDNDFKYTNYKKKEYTYDENHNITGSAYPRERNKNGSFKDLHILQELYYDAPGGNRLGLSAWFSDMRRGIPMAGFDYREQSKSKTRQDEKTLRSVLSWERYRSAYKMYAKAGYTYTDLQYLYLGDLGNGTLQEIIHSQSYVNTVFAKFGGDYYPGSKWMLTGNITGHQHFIKSNDYAVVNRDGELASTDNDRARIELSVFAAVKYRPTERFGLALNLREEMYGTDWSPVIPAFFAEYLISKSANLSVKGSLARNYRYPTLNDLYFRPGGNENLKPEKGYTYDIGIEAGTGKNARIDLSGGVTVFDSHIRDWILWTATHQGFWTPVNIKKVHSYGLETKAKLYVEFSGGWNLRMDGNFTLTNAINYRDPINEQDASRGRQLVYIPKYSSSVIGKLGWRTWTLTYKWNYYSERFTTTDNQTVDLTGRLAPYYMSDIALEKSFSWRRAGAAFKVAVNNLFGEEYESVLSRPMAGRNFGLYIEITPKFRSRSKR